MSFANIFIFFNLMIHLFIYLFKKQNYKGSRKRTNYTYDPCSLNNGEYILHPFLREYLLVLLKYL